MLYEVRRKETRSATSARINGGKGRKCIGIIMLFDGCGIELSSILREGKKRKAFNDTELRLIDECIRRCTPMLVFEHTRDWEWCYCPSCYSILDREYMRCCNCCGQRLKWHGSRKYAVSISHAAAMERREKSGATAGAEA